jgi:hypothetical protein
VEDIHSNFTTRLEDRTKDATERLDTLRAKIGSLEEVGCGLRTRVCSLGSPMDV